MPQLQYRVRGYNPFTENHQPNWPDWADVPPRGLESICAARFVDAGSLYLSSADLRICADLDLEIRVKPDFVPGFYQPRRNARAAVVWYSNETQLALGEDDLILVNVVVAE